MKQEDLLDAIGDVDEEYIAEAVKKRSAPPWLKSLALCALWAMAFIVLVLPFRDLGFGAGGKAPEPTYDPDYEVSTEELIYTHYAGPLLPLTLLEDCPDITAARRVEYDFSAYDHDGDWFHHSGHADVVDTYALTNESDQPRTVTVVYPFIGSLLKQEQFPGYTLNGEPVTPTLHPGPASGTPFYYLDLTELRSYLEYAELLSDGSYFARATDAPATLDIPVTVYQFTELTNQTDPYVESPVLRIEFEYNPKQTTIFSDGLSSGYFLADEYDGTGVTAYERLVRQDRYTEEVSAYLIVIGEDLKEYRLKGYRNMMGYNGGHDQLEGVSCTVVKFESTLGEMLRTVVADDTEEFSGMSFLIPPEDLDLTLELAAELMLDHDVLSPSSSGQSQALYYAAYAAYEHERVFYATTEITIPAGETVEFAVNRIQNKSYCSDRYEDAYDLCTTLGSNLRFSEQTVHISGWDWIAIARGVIHQNGYYFRENYGFDPENGITEVTLDLDKPYYWFEIEKKQ